jgi:hypothetical protein
VKVDRNFDTIEFNGKRLKTPIAMIVVTTVKEPLTAKKAMTPDSLRGTY